MTIHARIIVLQALLVLSQVAQAQTAQSQSLIGGWNLLGNNSSAVLEPISVFGNAATPVSGISDQVITVWKWDPGIANWMFFAPSFDAAGLASYAAGKSYGVMTSIASGDGYWVNAKAPLTIPLPSSAQGETPASRPLVMGWNLLGNNSAVALDPNAVFGNVTTPLSGITSQIVTVWKWDRVNTNWMFFNPSLDAAALATYAAGKSYGVLSSILPGEGYWVNAAAAISFALPPTLSGIAASGGPIANGAVTLTCGDGSTRTATTDANGAYAITLGTCAAPFVVSATGMIGDAQETLVSVHPSAIASTDSSLTVNVTPLTHALAATVASSGDPLDLVENFSAEKTNINATAVNQRKIALAAALADTLTTAGIDPTKFDLVNTRFRADRSGLDKVLDNVKVEIMPTGVSMTNDAGVKVDDMGDTPPAVPAADLSGGTVSFNNATDFTVALPKLPAALDDHSIGDAIRDALNACFAQPAAARGTFAALLGACQTLPIAADYKHDGRGGSGEFDDYLTNTLYDNAQFARPEIIRFFSNSDTDDRALIKFALTRSDGVVESFFTVAEKSTKTGGGRQLRGNRRPFKAFVSGFVTKREQVAANGANKPKSTYYSTGITIHFGFKQGSAGGSSNTATWNAGSLVSYVKVTGPGLPTAGVFLNPTLTGCDSKFAIAASSTATPPNCTNLFRLSSRAVTSADTDSFANAFGSSNPAFPSAKMDDASIRAIKRHSAYKFEIWRVGNATATPDHVFYERLRSRPYTMGSSAAALDGEIDKVRWDALSADTIALIDPTSSTTFAGGFPSTFPVAWTNAPHAAPIRSIEVQTRQTGGTNPTTLYEDKINVRFSANSAGLSNPNQNGWPTTMKTTTSTGLNFVKGIARNRFDSELFVDYQY